MSEIQYSITATELKEVIRLLSTGQWKCTTFRSDETGTFVRLSDERGGIREYFCPIQVHNEKFVSGDRVELTDNIKITFSDGIRVSTVNLTSGTRGTVVGKSPVCLYVVFDSITCRGTGNKIPVRSTKVRSVPNEVVRRANPGDYIKPRYYGNCILKVIASNEDMVAVQTVSDETGYLFHDGYVVLRG